MKKVFLALCLGLFTTSLLKAQSKLPASYLNVGLGVGMNYGIIGTKTVIGYKNSGLLVGLGYLPGGFTGYEVGAQLGINWFFANFGYGTIGTYQVNNEDPQVTEAFNLMVGAMIGLGQSKRTFIDLGVGHTFGAPAIESPLGEIEQNAFTIALGVGYRFGTIKKRD